MEIPLRVDKVRHIRTHEWEIHDSAEHDDCALSIIVGFDVKAKSIICSFLLL